MKFEIKEIKSNSPKDTESKCGEGECGGDGATAKTQKKQKQKKNESKR